MPATGAVVVTASFGGVTTNLSPGAVVAAAVAAAAAGADTVSFECVW